MKKSLLAVIFALIILVVPVFAQNTGVRDMSDTQLIELYETVKAEPAKRTTRPILTAICL